MNHTPWFGIDYEQNQNSEIKIATQGLVQPDDDNITIHFTAQDQDTIAGLWLVEAGEYLANLLVNSTSVDTFVNLTAYQSGETRLFDLWLSDIFGNTFSKTFQIEIGGTGDKSMEPYLVAWQSGTNIFLDALKSSSTSVISKYHWACQLISKKIPRP